MAVTWTPGPGPTNFADRGVSDDDSDTLNGLNGNDTLIGGLGDDTLDGGSGQDSLSGGEGDDSLIGGISNDFLSGGAGNDTLSGGNEADTLYGDEGDDELSGGGGSDELYGGLGGDSLVGDAGNDTLFGEAGDDTLDGGVNVDELWGGEGNDSLLGGGGSDTLIGGAGADILDGGASRDTASFTGSDAAVFVNLEDGTATGGHATGDVLTRIENLDGSSFADELTGDFRSNVLNGGAGNDTLDGRGGSDTLTGGAGDDLFIWDGNSNDTISDFGTDSGNIADGDTSNNDHVDLSGIFNTTTLAAYNAANGTTFTDPLAALNHDVQDGVIDFNGTNMSGPRLTLTGITGGLTFDQTNVGSAVCFTRGTNILVKGGARRIEDLSKGDFVHTMDNGLQPVRWVGSTHLSAAQLEQHPNLRPIQIRAGALGNGMPEVDLTVSPQHRILVGSRIAGRMFGSCEILVAAKKLLPMDGVDVVGDAEDVEYFHILFDRHEVVFSNGAPTESLFTGPEALKAVPAEAAEEILTLFPQLAAPGFKAVTARPVPRQRQQIEKLLQRHAKNGRPILEAERYAVCM